MRQKLIYGLLLINFLFVSCEEVYHADLDSRENFIVLESRIIVGENDNYVKLSETKGFNEGESFNPVEFATVKIVDSNNEEFELVDAGNGIYLLDFQINRNLQYKIQINYKDDTFVSDFEMVPDEPNLDSIYSQLEVKIIEVDGENNVKNFKSTVVFQTYADMNSTTSSYYLFSSKKILQYIHYKIAEGEPDTVLVGWETYYPTGIFNIAGPPDKSDSKNITRHPLFFFESTPQLPQSYVFKGWIYILYQYGITESAFSYYTDLNYQLGSDGKLFDPMYVQARNNLKCISDPQKFIMGNFEILTAKEYRYYIHNLNSSSGTLKEIPYYYDIPVRGEILEDFPDFWETPHKTYPDEK